MTASEGSTVFGDEAPATCVRCQGAIEDEYHVVARGLYCAECFAAVHAPARRGGQLLDGLLYGLLAAFAASAAWAAIIHATGHEFGLVAIAAGAAIGKAVRYGSKDRGGLPSQCIAAALTCAAILATPVLYVLASEGLQLASVLDLMLLAVKLPFIQLEADPGEGVLGLVIIGVGTLTAWGINRGDAEADGPYGRSTRAQAAGRLLCQGCGASVSPALHACPLCGELRHRVHLAAIEAAARGAEARGDLEEAISSWREAAPLLPSGGRVLARVDEEIDRLKALRDHNLTHAGT